MTDGSVVARGLIPSFFALSFEMSTMEEAAAFRGEEFAGVMTPSFLDEGSGSPPRLKGIPGGDRKNG